ncbi:farnesol dehydrogenase-like [Anastrepha ludens]|uniref:farnesol dehydrogenase-like n=1 Tax=Anastrepha ludens TaxID=28586 RepID=UPI0023AFA50D|nr:farnesol dehydrogenase-like [Anastrepha ludens]
MYDSYDSLQEVAIVTSAGGAIAAQIAVFLANKGMTVVGLTQQPEVVEALNEQIEGHGKIVPRVCDVTSEESLMVTFNYIRNIFPQVTVFVCNSDIMSVNFLSESSGAEIQELFDVNVISTSYFIRESLALIRAKKTRGHIFVMNSVLGHHIPSAPVPLYNVYPATKFAMKALCEATRREIKHLKLNVKLTSISPGMVDKELFSVYNGAIAVLPMLKASDIAKAIIFALDTPDYVQVEEIILQAMKY